MTRMIPVRILEVHKANPDPEGEPQVLLICESESEPHFHYLKVKSKTVEPLFWPNEKRDRVELVYEDGKPPEVRI